MRDLNQEINALRAHVINLQGTVNTLREELNAARGELNRTTGELDKCKTTLARYDRSLIFRAPCTPTRVSVKKEPGLDEEVVDEDDKRDVKRPRYE
jgi:chromosome segregation ATPase